MSTSTDLLTRIQHLCCFNHIALAPGDIASYALAKARCKLFLSTVMWYRDTENSNTGLSRKRLCQHHGRVDAIFDCVLVQIPALDGSDRTILHQPSRTNENIVQLKIHAVYKGREI